MFRLRYAQRSVGFPHTPPVGWARALALGALLLASGASAADLNGRYRWGGGQTLVVKSHDGKVEANATGAGGCGLDPAKPVLTGDWEGNVLVGKVTLCQIGPGCVPAQYVFLGFYNSSDGSLTADLELEGSCELPALSKDGRLVLEPVSQDGFGEISATDVAEKRHLGQHTARGQQLLHEDDAEGAMHEFQRAIERREDASAAWHGMGLAEANQRKWPQAVKYYKRSLQVRHDPFVYYNLACAYSRMHDKRNALANLRLAIQNGFASDQDITKEEDFVPFLSSDPEFHDMVAKLQEKHPASP